MAGARLAEGPAAPILALPDEDRPFSVVCDASDFAIGCALLQVDAEGRGRVVSFQPRQLKAAEKNYPVHDKELLAMKYALVKFRVHLLCQEPFVIYTDHASLRTATSSPHLSQRMARWLSFFAEYNVTVEYKPGKQNVLADTLSRRPDYELAHLAYLESPLYELIHEAYAGDDDLAGLVEVLSVPNKNVGLTARQRSRLHRYSVVEGLFYYQVDVDDEPRIGVPNDEDLRHRVLYEAHDTPLSGHLGRAKTYTSVARNLWWSHMYKWANAEGPRAFKGLRTSVKRNLLSFVETGEAVRQRVRDAMAAAQDRQKENSDRQGRANTQVFQLGDQGLLNAKTICLLLRCPRASESSRDARIRSAALPRRSSRIATAGNSPDPVLDQGGPPAQVSPANSAAGDASPRELRDQPQRRARQSGDDHAASPSPPAGHPDVADSFPRPIAGHPDSRSLRQPGHHHAVPASDAERLDQSLHRAPPPLLGTGVVPYFQVEKILRRRLPVSGEVARLP
ncbi:unnamed protein product [Phytophthora fragariaefolia]|uniref:Unnamed protein product n=1 Tax=Phytophthora fragariaefolia TaxID=1490495 RepID=A0A9W6XPA8_9STRA|nr:unnamed protein product [Phytophthora fragariaefolia]